MTLDDHIAVIAELRRNHVVKALKQAETIGAMKSSLVNARLAALTRPTATAPPAPPPRDNLAWLREGRQPGCQHEFQSGLPSKPYKRCRKCGFWMARREGQHPGKVTLPAVLAGRELPPEGEARVHKHVRISPSVTVTTIDEMEMHSVDVYTRLSKSAMAALKADLHIATRWQWVGSVLDTQWWRVARFLRKKKARRLDPEALRIAIFELIHKRPYPPTSTFGRYMAKRRRSP